MTTSRCACGHEKTPRTYTKNGHRHPLTLAESIEPARLLDLATRRPEIADLGLLRVATGCLESA